MSADFVYCASAFLILFQFPHLFYFENSLITLTAAENWAPHIFFLSA